MTTVTSLEQLFTIFGASNYDKSTKTFEFRNSRFKLDFDAIMTKDQILNMNSKNFYE